MIDNNYDAVNNSGAWLIIMLTKLIIVIMLIMVIKITTMTKRAVMIIGLIIKRRDNYYFWSIDFPTFKINDFRLSKIISIQGSRKKEIINYLTLSRSF